uniref:WD_REPEATS_REGION domain-containing protein n=2 Tax=Caenorhabditis tropicalis TaxID=1561998 RepID=A0A1I7TQR2_9PELO
MAPGISAAANQMTAAGSSVRVSFLDSYETSHSGPMEDQPCSSSQIPATRDEQNGEEPPTDIICFNVGKELYVYSYKGIQTETDLSRPIDKRVYKGTSPTVHIFNQATYGPRTCQLVIGFTLGQIQIIDPLEKAVPSAVTRLYNEDRFIEKTSVTCLRFLPNSANVFLASYVSGNIYAFDDRFPAITIHSNGNSNTNPWVIEVTGEKYTTYTLKAGNNTRNPILRWKIGEGSLHQFEFSPDGKMMATVSHDGFLRVFNYDTRELIAIMKSYFGGLLSLSWSPDSKLVATGGEDDLLTVFHVAEKRVVCRGQAHKSWISQVKFDHHAPFLPKNAETKHTPTSEYTSNAGMTQVPCTSSYSDPDVKSVKTEQDDDKKDSLILYRIGTVGHDTCLCFWDITKFMMNPDNVVRHRNSKLLVNRPDEEGERLVDSHEQSQATDSANHADFEQISPAPLSTAPSTSAPEKKGLTYKVIKRMRANHNDSKNKMKASNGEAAAANSNTRKNIAPVLASQISCCVETRVLGSSVCPGIRDVPMIEPVMCKKVAHDRLTVLEFRNDCVVTACQEGYICTWARPSPDDLNKGVGIKTPSAETPESEQKPSVSATASSYGYGSEISNGAVPSRSSSLYSNNDQQIRSPNATSPSYRVDSASTSVYHRPTYAWQNAN